MVNLSKRSAGNQIAHLSDGGHKTVITYKRSHFVAPTTRPRPPAIFTKPTSELLISASLFLFEGFVKCLSGRGDINLLDYLERLGRALFAIHTIIFPLHSKLTIV